MEYAIIILGAALVTTFIILATVHITKSRNLCNEKTASGIVLKIMEDAMIILDSEWRFLCCNESANKLFSSLASLPKAESIKNSRDWPRELEEVDKLTEIIFETEREGAYGPVSTYRANMNKIMDAKGMQLGWYIMIHDITEMNFLINQLKNLATTDSLTGVANRRSFLEKVEREIEMSMPDRLNTSNALIMYDIDDFKKVNDTYGHAAGDRVLCEVVEVIKKQLRSYDIIARYGGEEFVIFMPSSKDGSLNKIATRLCKAIEKHEIYYNGTRIPVTASFGAVQMPPGAQYEEAMLAVDEAMYEAKHNGKNQVVLGNIKINGKTAG
ncbi:MAG: GGDEF domain-containing protein [Oscillospiraceae bacterium]|nr:GGDEF domain-containing protein [Oscillospiraceae bacterium]